VFKELKVCELLRLQYKKIFDLSSLAMYLSCDLVKEIDSSTQQLPSSIHADYLAILTEPGVPQHKLHLKVSSLCSIMRNMCIEKGLVKNVRVRIMELHRHIVRVELLNDRSSITNCLFYLS
jgi:hypothetical protein